MRLKSTIITLALALPMMAGNPPSATFTRFSYTGQDAYYDANPLSGSQEFYNPVIQGWASDPSVCRVDSDYYLVTSTFCYFPGVPIYHSRDLVHWKQIGNALSRQSQIPSLAGQDIGTGGVYAPAIRYNERNKTFYMITTDEVKGTFYVTAKDPAGEWSDPVYLPAVNGIDPSFFFDDDGQAYIIHKEDTKGQPKWNNHRAIRIIRFDMMTGLTFGEDMPFREYGVGPEERLPRDEGPHIYKINGKYYVVCAEGGTSFNHSAVCYQADSVLGPYRRWPRNPMLTQRGQKIGRSTLVACAGHADMVQKPDGEWWAVFLATRPVNNGFENLGRETFLMPVKWSRDGFPYITQDQDTVPMKMKCDELKVNNDENAQTGNFSWTDNFNEKTLGAEWLMLWGDASPYYKLKKGLHLQCRPNTFASKTTPAYIGHRLQHHCFIVDVNMEFQPDSDNTAGLMLVKNEGRQYYLSRNASGVTLWKCRNGKRQSLGSTTLPLSAKAVTLRVVSEGTTFSFYVKAESTWQPVAEKVDAKFLSSGGFTGTTIGMYAESR